MGQIDDLLIFSINKEWEAYLKYAIHASYIQSMNLEPIYEHLNQHADDEKGHADRLTLHLLTRGVTFGIKTSVDILEPHIAGDMIAMLADDLEGEVETVERYVKILEMCEEMKATDTALLLEGIIVDEVEHQDDLAMVIMAKKKQAITNADAEEIVSKEEPKVDVASIVQKLVKSANKLDVLGMSKEASKLDNIAGKFLD